MTNAIDQTLPPAGEKWTFDRSVTQVFDNMLSRSIPSHDDMRMLSFDLGRRFVQPNSDVLDLGCSRGASLAPFVDAFAGTNGVRCVGLDESSPMLTAARERFVSQIAEGSVSIRKFDLRDGLPGLKPSVILSILTLQFVAIEARQRVVADAFRILKPGGVLIVVEKCLGDDAATQSLFVDAYHDIKRTHGYSNEQIQAKAASLTGVLVPLTPSANVAMFEREGFHVSQFWQSLQFVGWLARKPGERLDETTPAVTYPKAA